MPKIENWSPSDEDYDPRYYPRAWDHDKEKHNVVIKKTTTMRKGGDSQFKYEAYFLNSKGEKHTIIRNVTNLEDAKREAISWMRANPDPSMNPNEN